MPNYITWGWGNALSHKGLDHRHEDLLSNSSTHVKSWVGWCLSLMLTALRLQEQMNLRIQGQVSLHRKFCDIQAYVRIPCPYIRRKRESFLQQSIPGLHNSSICFSTMFPELLVQGLRLQMYQLGLGTLPQSVALCILSSCGFL